jgi:hypothetical protein
VVGPSALAYIVHLQCRGTQNLNFRMADQPDGTGAGLRQRVRQTSRVYDTRL